MYNAVKHKLGGRSKAAIVALLCAVYLLCFVTVGYAKPNGRVHVDGTVKVDVIKADIIKSNNIDLAESSVTANGDKVAINISGLKCPGAGATIRITVKNTGTLKATLVDIQKNLGTIDYFKIDISDIPIGDVIAVGDTCTFDAVAYWDPARTELTSSSASTDFGFVLVYENDEYVDLPSGGDPDDNGGNGGNAGGKTNGGKTEPVVPKTGDSAAYGVFAAVAGVAAVTMIVCLFLIIFGRKKREEEEEC